MKREQYVLVDPATQSLSFSLLARLCHITPAGQRLFPFGYQSYNASFKLAEAHYGLSMGTTAHSARAGFATHLVLQGCPRKEVQARGRWLSESSFNTYIDVSGASHIAAQVASQKLASTASWLETRIWRYFDLEDPSHGSSQKKLLSRGLGQQAGFPVQICAGPASSSARPSFNPSETSLEAGKMARAIWRSAGTGSGTSPSTTGASSKGFGNVGTRGARSSISGRLFRSLRSLVGSSFVLLLVGILLAFCGGAEGPLVQVGRLLGIAADLGEATSVAAGQAVNVTGAIAHAATDVITSATSNGLNTAENIWRGIDVSDLEIHRCAGILTLDDEHVLADC